VYVKRVTLQVIIDRWMKLILVLADLIRLRFFYASYAVRPYLHGQPCMVGRRTASRCRYLTGATPPVK
jgi:hypothetical protein